MTDINPVSSTETGNERYFPETGQAVHGGFLEFFNRYGLDLCGYPITPASLDRGRPVQYFQRIALEESEPGVVRLLPIGAELLDVREQLRLLRGEAVAPVSTTQTLLSPPPFAIDSLVGRLATHASARYPQRALSDIRRLVIHRTGVPAHVGPETVAEYHVHRQGWPGIGYHFVVGGDGHIWQTNGLVIASYHAREFNPSAVGIALAGAYGDPEPGDSQLRATARLCAWLILGLHLSPEAVQGHREVVHTACPGESWSSGAAWGRQLQGRVRTLLGLPPEEVPAPALEPAAAAGEWAPPQPDTGVSL